MSEAMIYGNRTFVSLLPRKHRAGECEYRDCRFLHWKRLPALKVTGETSLSVSDA